MLERRLTHIPTQRGKRTHYPCHLIKTEIIRLLHVGELVKVARDCRGPQLHGFMWREGKINPFTQSILMAGRNLVPVNT